MSTAPGLGPKTGQQHNPSDSPRPYQFDKKNFTMSQVPIQEALMKVDLDDVDRRVFAVIDYRQFRLGPSQGSPQVITLAELMERTDQSRCRVMQALARRQ